MTQARKLLQECCERCTEWSSTDACEEIANKFGKWVDENIEEKHDGR